MKAKIAVRVLMQRINRRLAKQGPVRIRQSSGPRMRRRAGHYYFLDIVREEAVATCINPLALAKQLGCLAEGEEVEGWTGPEMERYFRAPGAGEAGSKEDPRK